MNGICFQHVRFEKEVLESGDDFRLVLIGDAGNETFQCQQLAGTGEYALALFPDPFDVAGTGNNAVNQVEIALLVDSALYQFARDGGHPDG